jgi:hypothetical protein
MSKGELIFAGVIYLVLGIAYLYRRNLKRKYPEDWK